MSPARLLILPALAAALLAPAPARAHAVGLSQGHYRPAGDRLEAELTFSRQELAAAAPPGAELAGWVAERVAVASARGPCPPDPASSAPAEADGLTVRVSYGCGGQAPATVRLPVLAELSPGHRHLADHRVLSAREPGFTLARQGAALPELARLGVEHILTGYDHLLFLFGLVLAATRPRRVLEVVTAFTVAHSLTLALVVLGGVAPSPRLVEPLIALSIAYVGLENLVSRRLERRWRVAFAFGLLHGFGFGGALAEVGVAPGEWPLVLLGFNLGVELGQLAVLAVLLPALALARRSPAWWARARPALSVAVVVPGLVWFLARVAA